MGRQGWIAAIATATTLTACSGAASPASETVTVTSERTAAAPPSEPASALQSWTMPNLIGSNLQDAQNAIQTLTNNEVFYSGSTDLTGQGRNQMMDANWQVCTSTPPPGATLTKDTVIDFGVVRIDVEECP